MDKALKIAELKVQQNIKKKKFYVLFLILGMSLILVISSAIYDSLSRVIAQLLILVLQYVMLDGILNDYFAE